MHKKFVELPMKYINKLKYTFMTLKGTCINIGCGADVRFGWENCDLSPINDEVRKLNITSADDLVWLSEISSNFIECNHVIGYLNYIQAQNFFNACFTSLMKNGKMVLEFPDIIKISKQLIENDLTLPNNDNYIELIRGIYAFDHTDAYDVNFNKQTYIFGWSGNCVRNMLLSIGFRQVVICDPMTHGKRVWRDSRIEAIK